MHTSVYLSICFCSHLAIGGSENDERSKGSPQDITQRPLGQRTENAVMFLVQVF